MNFQIKDGYARREVSILDGMPTPEKVRELEKGVLALPQVDLQTTNVVHGEMCARTFFVPAGTIVTGAQTNKDNIVIFSGDITVTTDEGTQRLTGYHVIKAGAGFKRAGVTHADTWVTTIWPTQLTDINEIEDEMTNESEMLQTRRPRIVYEKAEVLT